MEESFDEPFVGVEAKSGPAKFALSSPRTNVWKGLGLRVWQMVLNQWFWRFALFAGCAIWLIDLRIRDYLRAIGSPWWMLF